MFEKELKHFAICRYYYQRRTYIWGALEALTPSPLPLNQSNIWFPGGFQAPTVSVPTPTPEPPEEKKMWINSCLRP